MLNDNIKIFLAVAEKRNFSKAAKSLFLTQPAVSFQIQMLEQYYGTVLFDRVNRNITLTAAGELLLKYANELSVLQAQLEREMQELTGNIKGKLLIGASTTIGEYILPYVVGCFKKKYPEVDVSLIIGNTGDIESRIQDTTLDVGLVEGPVNGKDLIKEKFLDDELILIAPIGHPLTINKKISIFELSKYPFISREKGSGTRHIMESAFKKVGFDPQKLNIIIEIGSTTAIKAAVNNGLGVAIVSKWTVQEMLKQNKLATVQIDEIKFERQFMVIYHEKKFRTQAVYEFLKFLRCNEVQ
ncbi:MAG: selenium metabolism-associated LysR family transcriptional regulator, partial [Peptococcales bacterium]